jgi:ribosome-associated heat shock protein Hsp15
MAEDAQRVDKWLWHARIVKTRTLAGKLVSAGHVRINRNKVEQPGHGVKIGDVLTIRRDRDILVYRVEGIALQRGPFPQARKLYADLAASSQEDGNSPPGDKKEE